MLRELTRGGVAILISRVLAGITRASHQKKDINDDGKGIGTTGGARSYGRRNTAISDYSPSRRHHLRERLRVSR